MIAKRLRRIGFIAATLSITVACTSILGDFEVIDEIVTADSGPDVTADMNSGDVAAPSEDAGLDAPTCSADRMLCDGGCVGNSADHCGSCAACPPTAPLCVVPGEGVSPSCGNNCPGAAPTLCGTTCVNTANDPNNCGSCGGACRAVLNGKATCEGDAGCSFECDSTFHACGSRCASNNDVATCGSSCNTPCPLPPANAMATCDGRTCGFKCTGTLTPCGNACFDLTSDKNHCGACPKVCSNTATCTNSSCLIEYGYTAPLGSNTACSVGYVFAMKIDIPKPVTVNRLGVIVRGVGYDVVMGLYSHSAVTGGPASRIVQTPPTKLTTTGFVEIPISDTPVAPGTYWVAITSDSGVYGWQNGVGQYYVWNFGTYAGEVPPTWNAGNPVTATLNLYLVAKE